MHTYLLAHWVCCICSLVVKQIWNVLFIKYFSCMTLLSMYFWNWKFTYGLLLVCKNWETIWKTIENQELFSVYCLYYHVSAHSGDPKGNLYKLDPKVQDMCAVHQQLKQAAWSRVEGKSKRVACAYTVWLLCRLLSYTYTLTQSCKQCIHVYKYWAMLHNCIPCVPSLDKQIHFLRCPRMLLSSEAVWVIPHIPSPQSSDIRVYKFYIWWHVYM